MICRACRDAAPRRLPGRQLVRLPAPYPRRRRHRSPVRPANDRAARFTRLRRRPREPLERRRPDRGCTRATAPRRRCGSTSSPALDGAVDAGRLLRGAVRRRPDKRVFGLLRMLCDALLVGAGTLRARGLPARSGSDERRRPGGARTGWREYPTLVVVSASLDLDPRRRLLRRRAGPADRAHPTRGAGRAGARLGRRRRRAARRRRPGRPGRRAGRSCAGAGCAQMLCEGGPHLFGGAHRRRPGRRAVPDRLAAAGRARRRAGSPPGAATPPRRPAAASRAGRRRRRCCCGTPAPVDRVARLWTPARDV